MMEERKKKPVQERSIATREKIIVTAEELFAHHGFEATTTNMIAREAGVSIGSLYSHFRDKWEIFLIILDRHSDLVYRYADSALAKLLEKDQSLAEAVKILIPGLYSINKRHGKLNSELERFIHVDERAAGLDEEWEKKEDELIIRFLGHFRSSIRIGSLPATARLINLQLRVLFNYLFKNQSSLDVNEYLDAYTELLLNSIDKSS